MLQKQFVNTIIILILFISFTSSASLITNGSFEQLTFNDGSTATGSVFRAKLDSFERRTRGWDVFLHLPGWHTSFGNGIELQKNIVSRSHDGSNHVELDSHQRGTSNSVMTQSLFDLTLGADYLLEFYYKPRTNYLNDNGINVFWYDASTNYTPDLQEVYQIDSTRKSSPGWLLQSITLTASSTSMNLSFGSFGNQNTLGGLIDNVSLNQVSKVPEPTTVLILLFGLICVLFQKRKLS